MRHASHVHTLLRFDVRRRLALLVILAVLPALTLVVWVGIQERRHEVDRVAAEMVRISRLAAVTHQEVIVRARHIAATLAQLPQFRERNAPACAAILTQLQLQFPSYSILLLADDQGQVLADSLGSKVVNVADRPYFQRALAARGFAVGNYAIGRSSRRPTLHCAMPVIAVDGAVIAMVVVGIDLSWLSHIAIEAKLPAGSVLTVLDREQQILARTLEPERWVGMKASDLVIAQLAARAQGDFMTSGPDDIQRIYGHSRLMVDDDPVGTVIVGVPLTTAYLAANRALLLNLLLVVAVAFIAMGVGLWLSRRLIERPLRDLCAATARIAEGEFAVAVPRSGKQGEFAALADSITAMADALAKREAEQRVAVAEVASAHELLSAIINAAPVAIMILDHAGRVDRVWNPAAETLYGWTRAEMLGHVPAMLQDEPGFASLLAAPGAEREHRRSDGTLVKVAIFAAMLHHGERGPDGLVAIIADISETRRLREELAQTQKMELVGRLAGGVAHDFNNLLAVITGFADLLIKKLPAGSSEREQASQIVGAAERAAELTGRLLTLARRQPIRRIVVDLSARVAGMARLLSQAVGKQVELRLILAALPCPVRMDPVQLDQVVMNLIVNARDALPAGGTVAITVASLDDAITVVVTDNGAGMSEEVRLRLFEPFFTTKGHGLGTGLGLATVKAIVDAAKGSIVVESATGVGTTVRILLPRAEPDNDPALAHRPGRLPDLVLVVDDEEHLRTMIALTLTAAGVQSIAAPDAASALARLDAGLVPAAVITDLVMPGLGGTALAREIRRRFPAMPVLFITGFADDQTVEEVLAFGGSTSLLPKPFTAAGLENALLILSR